MRLNGGVGVLSHQAPPGGRYNRVQWKTAVSYLTVRLNGFPRRLSHFHTTSQEIAESSAFLNVCFLSRSRRRELRCLWSSGSPGRAQWQRRSCTRRYESLNPLLSHLSSGNMCNSVPSRPSDLTALFCGLL